MTIQLYAKRKKWDLKEVEVHLSHSKTHVEDCVECEKPSAKIDQFTRIIRLEGKLDDEQKSSILAIANKCPVHRTLIETSTIVTQLA